MDKVISQKQMRVLTEIIQKNSEKDSNEARLSELKEFLYRAFTVEGLNEYLSQVSAEDIKQTYKELQNIVRR